MTIVEDLLGINFGLDQFILIAIIIAALLRKKSFFTDWLPFLVLWFTYDLMRTIADDQKFINVTPVYDLELFLFGWMFGGKIPAFWAQEYQNIYVTLIFATFYTLHMIIPLIVASSIYYKSNDRELFKEFTYAFLITSYLALITFALYPVAPPWYIWNDGGALRFTQPEILTNIPSSAAGLVEVDRLFGTNLFGGFYGRFNANPYAAVPSLHAAYSSISAYYAIKKYGWNRTWWMIFYPLGVFTAAVYLNHHFIVDLAAGVLYVFIGVRISRLIRKSMANRRKDKQEEVMPEDPEGDNGPLAEQANIVTEDTQIEEDLEIKS